MSLKVGPAKQVPGIRYAVGLAVVEQGTGKVLLLRRPVNAKKADGSDESWRGLYQVGCHGGVDATDWCVAKVAKKAVRQVTLRRECAEELGEGFAKAVLTPSRLRDLKPVAVKDQDGKNIVTYLLVVTAEEADLIVIGPEHEPRPVWATAETTSTIKTPDEVGGNKTTVYDGPIVMFPDEREVVRKLLGVTAPTPQPSSPPPVPQVQAFDRAHPLPSDGGGTAASVPDTEREMEAEG